MELSNIFNFLEPKDAENTKPAASATDELSNTIQADIDRAMATVPKPDVASIKGKTTEANPITGQTSTTAAPPSSGSADANTPSTANTAQTTPATQGDSFDTVLKDVLSPKDKKVGPLDLTSESADQGDMNKQLADVLKMA